MQNSLSNPINHNMFNQLDKLLLSLNKGGRSDISSIRKVFEFQLN